MNWCEKRKHVCKMRSFLLFSSILVLSLGSSLAAPLPYACPSNTDVSPPTNIDEPYFFPNNWNDNQIVPQYQPGQNCKWIVTVPKGYYAKLVMQGKAQSDSFFQVIDSAYHYDTTLSATRYVEYYYPTQFKIVLNAGDNYGPGTFAFKIVGRKVMPTTTPLFFPVASGSAPAVRHTSDAIQGAVVFAGTQVSVVPVAANGKSINDLRGVMLFDGPSSSSNYVGNLYHSYYSGRQLVSSGSRFTLVNVNSNPNTENYFVAQDYTNTKQFNGYKGVVCSSTTDCPVALSGLNGPAGAIAIFDGDETLNSAKLDDTTTLKVYSGGAKDHNLLAQYNKLTINQSLPQKFGGVMRQYTIDTGNALLHLSRS